MKKVGSTRARVFLRFLESLFMVSETLEPLISMTPIMVLKVFLKYRRSAFEVDSASQKSWKIGVHLTNIRQSRFVNRAQTTHVFISILEWKNAPKGTCFGSRIHHKSINKGAFCWKSLRESLRTPTLMDFRWMFGVLAAAAADSQIPDIQTPSLQIPPLGPQLRLPGASSWGVAL